MRVHALVFGAVVAAVTLAGCHSSPHLGPQPAPPGNFAAAIQTDLGTITVQLFPKAAPLTVGNFIGLAEGTQKWVNPRTGKIEAGKPFYNGLTFHRVIPNFMIQGGDPLGNGSGTPGYAFANEVSPDLTFDRPGRLAMANAGPNTNGSQFFITVAPYPSLNGNYTIFGQVISGQNVADAISQVPRDGSDNRPLTPVHIIKITIHRTATTAP
ncbi:MAG: peptidylprolyl isomerase [Acidobacteria bacterium]|nr:MAG: peptidylprolyl isomerase [Acidobacteriota bacterium]